MPDALAYFITFTTYGTWLHGRDPGSVDRSHNTPGTPFLPPDRDFEQSRRETMRQDPYALDEALRAVVLNTILEVVKHRNWKLWAAHVRTTHVHIVVTASAGVRTGSVSDGVVSTSRKRKRRSSATKSFSDGHSPPGNSTLKPPHPKKVMNDFKAWVSRRLREAFGEPSDRDRWTQHGSTIWLNTHESLLAAIKYVVEEQGEPMACFDGNSPAACDPE